jgi:hypothetical protein
LFAITITAAICIGILFGGYKLAGKDGDKFLVDQQMLCAGNTGIIYQHYNIYDIFEKDEMRFMSPEEYQTYCTHAGSIERETK